MKRKIKDYLFTACIFLFAAWSLVTALYTYGALHEQDVQCCAVEIMSAEKDYTHRKTWLILQTAVQETFYCRLDLLPKEARAAVDQMLDNSAFPVDAVIASTTRKNVFPTNFIEFTDYNRMVALSVDGSCVIGLEHYNQANKGLRGGFIFVFVLSLLIGAALLCLCLIADGCIAPWNWRKYKKKRRKADR